MSAQGQQACVALQSGVVGQPWPLRIGHGEEPVTGVAEKSQILP